MSTIWTDAVVFGMLVWVTVFGHLMRGEGR